jgi:hypothetical protein
MYRDKVDAEMARAERCSDFDKLFYDAGQANFAKQEMKWIRKVLYVVLQTVGPVAVTKKALANYRDTDFTLDHYENLAEATEVFQAPKP